MRRNLDATETQVEAQSEIYFIEVSSNVYFVKKCRDEYHFHQGEYATGKDVVFALNEGYEVGIKSLALGLISNFQVYISY